MLASAYGLQYDLPQRGQMEQGQQVKAVNAQQDIYGEENLLNSDLYVKEGVTDEYYKKVAALKSFANEVSSRYGIDVTRPNYRNAESIRFHKSYLQALADIQMSQNELKRLSTHENAALVNPNIRVRQQEGGSDYFVNEGENDVVKAMRSTRDQIKSRKGAQDFELANGVLIEQLQEELSSSQNPKERDQIGATIRQLQALKPDIGISDAAQGQLDLQREQLDESKRSNRVREGIEYARLNKSGESSEDPFAGLTSRERSLLQRRIQTITTLANNESLKSLGFNREDRSSGTYLTKEVNGKKRSVLINPNDPAGTLRNINEIMNEGEGAPVSYDLLSALGDKLDLFGDSLIEKISPSKDVFTDFMKNFDSTIKDAGAKPEVRKGLAESLKVSNGKVSPTVFSVFPNGKSVEGDIVNVVEGRSMFGETFGGGSFIEVYVKESGNSKALPKKKAFYLNNDEDVKLLKEIFESNKQNINIPNLSSQGTVVAPTSGVDIIPDKM